MKRQIEENEIIDFRSMFMYPVEEERKMKKERMKIELMYPEEGILEELKSGDFTRDEIALTYAFCISSSEDIHFGKINRAIQERWSRNAVIYIKTKAWKLVEEKK